VTLHIGRVSVVVNASLVTEDSLLVVEEDVRSADCSIFSGDLLSLVTEIWKVEAFVLGSRDHVFKTVLRISGIIVAIDSDQTSALGQIVPLKLNHSALVCLHVGTVIAAEDDCESLLVSEALERVRFAVYSLQLEVYGSAAERKSNGANSDW